MSFEREVLVSLLKITREGAADFYDLCRETRIPSQIVRDILDKNSNLVTYSLPLEKVMITYEQRMKIALRAINLGADIERVCTFLTWLEFENMAILAFKANDYETKKHFRFRWFNRRWEIDILGLKNPFIICADCKHWHHKWSGSASIKAANMQMERTKMLAEAFKALDHRIPVSAWKYAYFIPMILSLLPANRKFYNNVPIVSVLQLRDFLYQVPAYLSKIAHYQFSL